MDAFWSYIVIVLGLVLLIATVPGLISSAMKKRRQAEMEEEDRLVTGVNQIKRYDRGFELHRFDTTADLQPVKDDDDPPAGRHGSSVFAARNPMYQARHAAPIALDTDTFAGQETRRRSLFTPTRSYDEVYEADEDAPHP